MLCISFFYFCTLLSDSSSCRQCLTGFFFHLLSIFGLKVHQTTARIFLLEFVQLGKCLKICLTLSFYTSWGLSRADSLYSQDLRVGGAALHLPPLPGGAHPPLRVPLLLRPLLCCGGQWLGQLMGNLCRPVIPTHTGDIFLPSFSFRNLFCSIRKGRGVGEMMIINDQPKVVIFLFTLKIKKTICSQMFT